MKKKRLTEDRKWRGALQSVELLLQSPPEVDLLQENLLELLCKRRKTDAKRIVRNEYTVKDISYFWWYRSENCECGSNKQSLPFSMFSTSFFSGTGEVAPWLWSPDNTERDRPHLDKDCNISGTWSNCCSTLFLHIRQCTSCATHDFVSVSSSLSLSFSVPIISASLQWSTVIHSLASRCQCKCVLTLWQHCKWRHLRHSLPDMFSLLLSDSIASW